MTDKSTIELLRQLEKENKFDEIIKVYQEHAKDVSDQERQLVDYIYSKALFVKGKYFKALEILEKLLTELKKEDELYLKVLHQKSSCLLVTGAFDQAKEVLNKLFNTSNLETSEVYPQVLINYANMLFYQGKLLEAKEQYEKALSFLEKKGLPIDRVLNNLVLIYSQLGIYQKALELSDKVIELKEQKGDWHGWSIALVNRSIVLSHFERREEAYKCLYRVLKFVEEKNWLRISAGAYGNLASLKMRDFEEDKAEEDLLKAKAILEEIKAKDILAPVITKLAYVKLNKNNLVEAEELIERLYELAEEQQSTFALVWSSLLEALLLWKRTRNKKYLISFLKFLHKQFDLEIHNMLFQSSFFMVYQFLLIDDSRYTKKALKRGLKTAKKLNNSLFTIKFLIALTLYYFAEGRYRRGRIFMHELIDMVAKYKLSFSMVYTIQELYAEFHSKTIDKNELRYEAYKELWNFIQNAIPLF